MSFYLRSTVFTRLQNTALPSPSAVCSCLSRFNYLDSVFGCVHNLSDGPDRLSGCLNSLSKGIRRL